MGKKQSKTNGSSKPAINTNYRSMLNKVANDLSDENAISLGRLAGLSDADISSVRRTRRPSEELLVVFEVRGFIKEEDVSWLHGALVYLKLIKASTPVEKYMIERRQSVDRLPFSLADSNADLTNLISSTLKAFYKKKFGSIQPVNWVNPISMETLFTTVCFVTSEGACAVQKASAEVPLSSFEELFLRTDVRGIIKGDPGSGKSTLVSHVAFEWAHGRLLTNTELLFVLPLRLCHNGKSLFENLKSYLFPSDTRITPGEIQGVLTVLCGRAVLILDGVDEMGSHFNQGAGQCAMSSDVMDVIQWNSLRETKVILTSRYFHNFIDNQYSKFKLLGFDDFQTKNYISKVIKDASSQKIVYDYLEFCGVGGIPLIVALVCEYFKINGEKCLKNDIQSLADFISKLEECFLYHNEESERTAKNVTDTDLKEMKLELGRLALKGLLGNQTVVWSLEDVNRQVKPHCLNLGLSIGIIIRGESDVTATGSTSLLNMRESTKQVSIQFIHKLFQEFMAAYYVANGNLAENLVSINDSDGCIPKRRKCIQESCANQDEAINLDYFFRILCGLDKNIAMDVLIHLSNLIRETYWEDGAKHCNTCTIEKDQFEFEQMIVSCIHESSISGSDAHFQISVLRTITERKTYFYLKGMNKFDRNVLLTLVKLTKAAEISALLSFELKDVTETYLKDLLYFGHSTLCHLAFHCQDVTWFLNRAICSLPVLGFLWFAQSTFSEDEFIRLVAWCANQQCGVLIGLFDCVLPDRLKRGLLYSTQNLLLLESARKKNMLVYRWEGCGEKKKIFYFNLQSLKWFQITMNQLREKRIVVRKLYQTLLASQNPSLGQRYNDFLVAIYGKRI